MPSRPRTVAVSEDADRRVHCSRWLSVPWRHTRAAPSTASTAGHEEVAEGTGGRQHPDHHGRGHGAGGVLDPQGPLGAADAVAGAGKHEPERPVQRQSQPADEAEPDERGPKQPPRSARRQPQVLAQPGDHTAEDAVLAAAVQPWAGPRNRRRQPRSSSCGYPADVVTRSIVP